MHENYPIFIHFPLFLKSLGGFLPPLPPPPHGAAPALEHESDNYAGNTVSSVRVTNGKDMALQRQI